MVSSVAYASKMEGIGVRRSSLCNQGCFGARVSAIDLKRLRVSVRTHQEIVMSHEQYLDCIEACNTCAAACEHCATACLHEKDVTAMADCIRLNRDCADICGLAAAWMERESEYANSLCEICAMVCNACAAECRRHSMEHCQACADACRRCAEVCRKMVGGAVPEAAVSIGMTG